MLNSYLLLFLCLLLVIKCIFCEEISRKLAVNDPKALKEAEFSLFELKKLSDSRIYDTLTLSKILSAEEVDGIYHVNTIFSLELASEYFKSGLKIEEFKVVVMRNKMDDSMSIAIDEFPAMDEASIEKFWIQKVKDKRKYREDFFKNVEIESLIENKFDF